MRWGAIVVGSGIGGLTTAAYLSASGVPTLVLEQYSTIGGCAQVFRRKKKFEFDVGVHYIGDCEPDGNIPTILRGLGVEDRIEFRQLDPDGYTTIVLPDLEFRVPAGWDNYRRRLLETFPEERRGLRFCLWVLERIGRALDQGDARKLSMFPLREPVLATFGMMPLKWLFDLCGLSERARAVICGEWGDYNVPYSKVPTSAHGGFLYYYVKSGGWYPKGGGQIIAATLLDVIQSHGGAVRTQARVERILIEDGRAVGVRLTTGEVIRAPNVVSNADVKRTYLDLVGPEHLRRLTVARAKRFHMAMPLATVYLGLDMDLRDRMPATQFWAHKSIDFDERYRRAREGITDPDFSLYVTSTTLKDPDNPYVAPQGQSAVLLMAMVPPDHDYWKVGSDPTNGDRYGRNPEYLAMKEEFTQRLIDRADELIPGLKDHIVWREASTPITHERYTLNSGGACYGLEITSDQFALLRPRAKTEIRGLYLTGADTVWALGVLNTMISGMGTASAILGRDLRDEVKAGRVIADPSRLPPHDPDRDLLFACRRLAEKPRSHRRQRELADA
jgi:phytoene dehydrogenase-like protein